VRQFPGSRATSADPSNYLENPTMKHYVKAYAMFLAFAAVTTLIVRPAAVRFNVPLLKDL
jgi:hypothetical protein